MSLKRVAWSVDQKYRPVTIEEVINDPYLQCQIAFITPSQYNTGIDLILDSKASGIKWIPNNCLNTQHKNYHKWLVEKVKEGRVRIDKTLEAKPMKVTLEEYEIGAADGFKWATTQYGVKHLTNDGDIEVIKVNASSPEEAIKKTESQLGNKKIFRVGSTHFKNGTYESEFSLLHAYPIIGTPLARSYYDKYVKELNKDTVTKSYNRLICVQSPNGKCYRIPFTRAKKIIERFKDWSFTTKSYYKKWKKEQSKPFGPAQTMPVSDNPPRRFRKLKRQEEKQHRSNTDVQKVKIKTTIKKRFLLESGQQLSLKTINQEWFDANFPRFKGHEYEVKQHFAWTKNKKGKLIKTNTPHHESLWVVIPKQVIKFKTIRVPKQIQVHKQNSNSKRIIRKKHHFEPIIRYVIRNGKKVEFTTYKRIKQAA